MKPLTAPFFTPLAAIRLLAIVLLCAVSGYAQTSAGLTIDDLVRVRRAGDSQLSPDGRTIAFTITDTDVAANRRATQIYLMPATGGEMRQLTNDKASSSSPRWSPDGKLLAFISARDGEAQIHMIDVASGKITKISNVALGADAPLWSPDGKLLAFTSEVYPACANDDCNRARAKAADENKVKAKVADRLLFRHWTSWKEGKRSHVFVVPATGGAAAIDLTPGDYDAPPFSLGGALDYTFSPDSKELAFARNTDKVEATSTNGDIFIVAVTGGEARRITEANRAADLSPQYSPDGRFIAYRAQAKPGFEADRWQLMFYDRQTNQTKSMTPALDTNIEGFAFTADGKHVFFTVGERGRQAIYSMDASGANMKRIIEGGINDDMQISRDGKTLIFTRNSLTSPVDIFRAGDDGTNVTQLTRVNESVLAKFNMLPAEEITWKGAGDTPISGWLIKPANFDASKKYPLLVLIHGGPQSAWNDAWSYRWNPQIFAGAGYVVFMPNPRGSTSFGQKFTDEISGDWGGKVFDDIKNGVAEIIKQPYIDQTRIGAAGGSYGGYMVNWIEGHNDDPRFKFKALMSHAGVFNLTSMYGATEELWFTDWEFKGTPWSNPEMYARWSPNMFIKSFNTPMLVIHGELDYRVPIGEGLQLFTALQLQNVKSKLLYFPDEGHWILKPQNSKMWYDTVLAWFDEELKS